MSLTDRLEHSGSAGPTTLLADITAGTTSMVLADATGYPTGGVGSFVVTLDRGTASEERVLCTSRSSNTITISDRGWDGSVARAHTAGAVVEHTWSQTEADQANAHTSASTGEHGITGAVVGTTDAQTLTNKTLTAPTIADFTNAGHDHGDADDGGAIAFANLTVDGDLDLQGFDLTNGRIAPPMVLTGTLEGSPTFDGTVVFSGQPAIQDFTNSAHDHHNAAEGGDVNYEAVKDFGGGDYLPALLAAKADAADLVRPVQAKVTTLWAAGNTSYGSGGCYVTIVAPPSGQFKVDAYGRASHQDSGATCWFSIAAYEGTGVGGTEVLAGANTRASATSGVNPGAVAVSEIITGYTPGDTYTISTSTKSSGGTGGNAEFALQSIIVTPLP